MPIRRSILPPNNNAIVTHKCIFSLLYKNLPFSNLYKVVSLFSPAFRVSTRTCLIVIVINSARENNNSCSMCSNGLSDWSGNRSNRCNTCNFRRFMFNFSVGSWGHNMKHGVVLPYNNVVGHDLMWGQDEVRKVNTWVSCACVLKLSLIQNYSKSQFICCFHSFFISFIAPDYYTSTDWPGFLQILQRYRYIFVICWTFHFWQMKTYKYKITAICIRTCVTSLTHSYVTFHCFLS